MSHESLNNQPIPNGCRRQARQMEASEWRDWCMDRLSKLSLDHRHNDARALTAEHLELLEHMDACSILWMRIEPI